MSRVRVIKIGGNVVDNPEALSAFLDDFASIEGEKILIHGGGKEATRLSKALDIPTTMIDGRRVTTADTLKVVTMVYAGLINKRIVSMLQARGVNALGLSGADGNLIPATRRNPEPIDFGYVGDIDPLKVNDSLLSQLLDEGFVPVICAICHDGHGTLLNCNADSVALAVAAAVARRRPASLTFCFEKPGVLLDPDNDSSVIELVTPSRFEQLKSEGKVSGGMLPKLSNALKGVEQGISSVNICHASAVTHPEAGTIIKL